MITSAVWYVRYFGSSWKVVSENTSGLLLLLRSRYDISPSRCVLLYGLVSRYVWARRRLLFEGSETLSLKSRCQLGGGGGGRGCWPFLLECLSFSFHGSRIVLLTRPGNFWIAWLTRCYLYFNNCWLLHIPTKSHHVNVLSEKFSRKMCSG